LLVAILTQTERLTCRHTHLTANGVRGTRVERAGFRPRSPSGGRCSSKDAPAFDVNELKHAGRRARRGADLVHNG